MHYAHHVLATGLAGELTNGTSAGTCAGAAAGFVKGLAGKLARGFAAFSVVFTVGFSSWAAKPIQAGFVTIEPDRELYVERFAADSGMPTVVLLNGLTYSTRYWDDFTQALQKLGIGVIRYDMVGMGRTVLRDVHLGYFPSRSGKDKKSSSSPPVGWIGHDILDRMNNAPLMREIPYASQVRDLGLLLDALNISEKVSLIGLSYGGAIGLEFAARHPHRVERLIAMAPYTEPMAEQDAMIKRHIAHTPLPWSLAPADQLYDFYLKLLVYATYGSAESSMFEHPYKFESVFRLAQGIRKWQSKDAAADLPVESLHLMIAQKDQYIKRDVLDTYWDLVPRSAQASYTVINDSEHKIPESVPRFAAAWVKEILDRNPVLAKGEKFRADPHTGVVKHSGGEIKVEVQSQRRASPMVTTPRTPMAQGAQQVQVAPEAVARYAGALDARRAIADCGTVH